MPLLLAIVLLMLAAPAQAGVTGPTPARKLATVDGNDPVGDGRRLLFIDPGGTMLRIDARTRRVTRIRTPDGCYPGDWDGRATFLVECGQDDERTYRLLGVRARRTVRYPGVLPGDYLVQFGTRWACGSAYPESGDYEDAPRLCVHRRSGRRVTPEETSTVCGRDLDRDDLRPLERCPRGFLDAWRGWRLDPEGALLLMRKGRADRTLLRHCSYECDGRLVDGRVTWWAEAGRAANVHLLDLRRGRRWRWRVSPIVQPSEDMFGDPIGELRTFPMNPGLLILRGRRQHGDAISPYDLYFVRWP